MTRPLCPSAPRLDGSARGRALAEEPAGRRAPARRTASALRTQLTADRHEPPSSTPEAVAEALRAQVPPPSFPPDAVTARGQRHGPSSTEAPRERLGHPPAVAASPLTLGQIAAAAGFDAEAFAALRTFAHRAGIAEAELAAVGARPRYAGAEKLEAMKAYAVLWDATNKKLPAERASELASTALAALASGCLGIRLRPLAGAHAQYNGKNLGNRPGWEPNTLYFPASGAAIDSPKARAVIVHEAQHVAQDALQRPQTFFEAEREAHTTAADYLLRDSSALVPTPEGLRLDSVAFDALRHQSLEPVDRAILVERFALAADENVRNRRPHLNGLLAEVPNAGDLIRSTAPNQRGFEDLYVLSLFDPGRPRTEAQRRRVMRQPAPHDGL